MSEHDFMPIDGRTTSRSGSGTRSVAFFYENAFGFTRTAYAGPETGVRERASYVLEQGDIRFVLTSGLRADSEICRWAATKGDSVKDVALAVPDATNAYRQAVQRGARGIEEPHWPRTSTAASSWPRSRPTATTSTRSSPRRVRRAVHAGLRLRLANGSPSSGMGLISIDHVVGNVELGRMDEWVGFYERVLGFSSSPTSRTRTSQPSTRH